MKKIVPRMLCVMMCFVVAGCATYDKGKRYDQLSENYSLLEHEKMQQKMSMQSYIDSLQSEIRELKTALTTQKEMHAKALASLQETQEDALARQRHEYETRMDVLQKEADDAILALTQEKQQTVSRIKEEAHAKVSELEMAKRQLSESLSKELSAYKAKLEMTERGLVLTFLAEIFFDSGKDVIKKEAYASLKKVAAVLNKEVIESRIAVEGHTDSDPIRHSHWQSNWELSTARALAVLHHFIDEGGVAPNRLSAVGCGEFHPVASNQTDDGKKQNRRVEIIILPKQMKKVK